jgi:hypothetical protein
MRVCLLTAVPRLRPLVLRPKPAFAPLAPGVASDSRAGASGAAAATFLEQHARSGRESVAECSAAAAAAAAAVL